LLPDQAQVQLLEYQAAQAQLLAYPAAQAQLCSIQAQVYTKQLFLLALVA
jgi:peroxiredoxin